LSDLGKRLIDGIEEFLDAVRNVREIPATEVRRIETPDGPLHLRKKIMLNEDKSIKRCVVASLSIQVDHPTMTGLKVVVVRDHQMVVGDHYDDGVLGIYIPDGAIIPDKLAEEMWVLGKLAGKKRNRVKARDFHGVFSDGLFYGSRFFLKNGEEKEYQMGPSWNPDWIEGQDVTEEIGVTFNE
jgi:hypothetical protein